ncbi:MAG: MmgE/PrpD family protein [Pseudomonadota bacterium]
MSGQISENPVLTELSDLLARPVERRDLHRARLHLLDWIGCAVAGAKEPAGLILRQTATHEASGVAFVWGGLGNILEMDDVDKRALLHPGPSIIPAALALADRLQSDNSDLLAAIVRGYDATIRLGRAVGPAHYAMWHSTGTCGAIGAAAAGANLLGLDETRTGHALALAMSQSAGIWHTRHDAASMGKQLHTSVAARAGLDAARLAQLGFLGPLNILEGEQGFFQAMCPDGDPRQVLVDQADWMIHDVSFKPWPACRHAHAAIDGALELRNRIALDQIDRITVRTYADALKFCDRPSPETVIEAKFSLQHSVATTLVRGAPTLEDFSTDSIQAPDLSALRAKVEVEIGAEFQDRYPARFGAEVSASGETVIMADALGDPENPIAETQLIEKAESLMHAGGMSGESSQALSAMVISDDLRIGDLMKRLREVLT